MIDLKAARNDPDGFRAALARKGAAETFDALLAADERWRALVPRVDELRARTKLKGKPTPEQVAELQQVKEDLRATEDELEAAKTELDELLLQVPNPPHASAPDGETEDDAEEISRWGEPPALDGAEGAHRDRPLRDGTRCPDVRLALRLPGRRHGAARVRALSLRARPSRRPRLHRDAAARARARAGDGRHRLLPDREVEHLRAGGGRPLSDRYVRGRARLVPHGRDHRRGRPAPALRRLLALFPARKAGAAGRDSYESALSYAVRRHQFDRPIASFQLTQQKLVDMVLEIQKGLLVAVHTGRQKDAGTLRPEQISFGKLNNVHARRSRSAAKPGRCSVETGSRSTTRRCATPTTLRPSAPMREPTKCTR